MFNFVIFAMFVVVNVCTTNVVMPHMYSQQSMSIAKGSRVITHGLITLSFNGHTGVTTSVLNADGRIGVVFDDHLLGGRAVKPNNLKLYGQQPGVCFFNSRHMHFY